MSPSVTAPKLDYEAYLRLPDDGRRHEVLDGEHVVSPAPSVRHQTVVANLLRLLGQWVYDHDLGRVWTAPLDVVLGPNDIVQPDLVFVSKDRLRIAGASAVHGAPDLVVEVVSPSTRVRDVESKRRIYEAAGVLAYWLIDPDACSVEVLVRADSSLRPAGRFGEAATDSLSSTMFPDLHLSLEDLFA